MAHAIQPDHKPHEQLRMEAPRQKGHSDKYVSAFVSGDPAVEMSFRNPVLTKSSDHFKVGIDELTVNLGNLSMLEGAGDIVFRVLRRGNNAGNEHATFYVEDGPAADVELWRNAFKFEVDRPFLTMLEIAARFAEIAGAVSTYINNGLAAGAGWTAQYAGHEQKHLQITINNNGQLRVSGNRLFWANFLIDVPTVKYRQIIFKDPAKRYVSLHPATGIEVEAPFTINPGTGALISAVFDPVWNINQAGALADLDEVDTLEYAGDGNLLNSLDRRVTIEVGCSLPIKNSPLVDHGQEAPDFVIGRYMFHKPYRMDARPGLDHTPDIMIGQLGTMTLQGPRDRIVYHHLQPQQKIQILRLKLWARVRTYNEQLATWGMKTIVCPVDPIDYWHVRLHFIEK